MDNSVVVPQNRPPTGLIKSGLNSDFILKARPFYNGIDYINMRN